MPKYDFPHGFALSESALYAFVCQDVYPDVLSFASAIPDHLKPLFLIPVQLQMASSRSLVAKQMTAKMKKADAEDAELFGTKTFVEDPDSSSPAVPGTEPGSIFDIDGSEGISHHQEYLFDQNRIDDDSSFMSSPIDFGLDYPYGGNQKVTHSSAEPPVMVLKLRIALQPDQLKNHVPSKIKDNAKFCSVSLVSYDPESRVFNFSVNSGNGAKKVKARLSEIDQVTMSCNCPFWRWNGPEFHAKENSFLLESPFGKASPPNVRDPDRKYWLCKHTYAALRRLDHFVQEVVDENWDKDDEELLDVVDEEWDRLEGVAKIPLEETEDDDIELEIDWDGDGESDDVEFPDEFTQQDPEEEPSEDEDETFDDEETDETEEDSDEATKEDSYEEPEVDYQGFEDKEELESDEEDPEEESEEDDYEEPDVEYEVEEDSEDEEESEDASEDDDSDDDYDGSDEDEDEDEDLSVGLRK